jgi:hypothetical protein
MHGRRRTDSASGWAPEHERDDLEATAWRARRALEATEVHASALDKLTASVDKLSSSFDAWNAAAAARWKTTTTAAKVLLVPVAVAASLGIGRLAWDFVSTLHH